MIPQKTLGNAVNNCSKRVFFFSRSHRSWSSSDTLASVSISNQSIFSQILNQGQRTIELKRSGERTKIENEDSPRFLSNLYKSETILVAKNQKLKYCWRNKNHPAVRGVTGDGGTCSTNSWFAEANFGYHQGKFFPHYPSNFFKNIFGWGQATIICYRNWIALKFSIFFFVRKYLWHFFRSYSLLKNKRDWTHFGLIMYVVTNL